MSTLLGKPLMAEAGALVAYGLRSGLIHAPTAGKTYEDLQRDQRREQQRCKRARLYAQGLNSKGQPRKTGGRPRKAN